MLESPKAASVSTGWATMKVTLMTGDQQSCRDTKLGRVGLRREKSKFSDTAEEVCVGRKVSGVIVLGGLWDKHVLVLKLF